MIDNSNNTPDHADADVKARAHALMLEIYTHMKECKAAHPELANEDRIIFEGWILQKIAGLQLSLEHLAVKLALHERYGHRPDPDA